MREVETGLPEGAIWNVRYADDTTIIAHFEEDLGNMAEHLRAVSKDKWLLINKRHQCAWRVKHQD